MLWAGLPFVLPETGVSGHGGAAAGKGKSTSEGKGGDQDGGKKDGEPVSASSVMSELCQAGGDKTAAVARRAQQQQQKGELAVGEQRNVPFELIRNAPYLRYIVLFELCATITRQLVDFQQVRAAAPLWNMRTTACPCGRLLCWLARPVCPLSFGERFCGRACSLR